MAARVAMVDQCTPIPAARPAPTTVKTRIWMVEVGMRALLKVLVSPKAIPMTMMSPSTDRPAPVSRLCPTVCSTPWLAKVAPMRVNGAINSRARRAEMADSAWGMPMHAPV
jgi:hypothetical protein